MTKKDALSRRGFLKFAGTSAGAVTAAGLLSACVVPVATPATATEEDVTAVTDVLTSGYQGAVNSHDAAAYADLFMDDVLWAPPNAPNATALKPSTPERRTKILDIAPMMIQAAHDNQLAS